jgi:hypothetical protein
MVQMASTNHRLFSQSGRLDTVERSTQMKIETPNSLAAKQKGKGPVSASFAKGGEILTTKSRFFKTQDTFRTDIQRTDYDKKGKGGELSKLTGDKSEKAIKPKT